VDDVETVGQEHGDAVAGVDAKAAQPACDPARALVILAVTEGLLTVAKERLVPVPRGAFLEGALAEYSKPCYLLFFDGSDHEIVR